MGDHDCVSDPLEGKEDEDETVTEDEAEAGENMNIIMKMFWLVWMGMQHVVAGQGGLVPQKTSLVLREGLR